MFEDPRARRAWRLFRLRADLMLSSVSASVRRELLEDLTAHVRDVLENDKTAATEYERLDAALQRIGDPKEFLAPLLAEAVFRNPPRDAGWAAAWRSLGLFAARGSRFLVIVTSILLFGGVGFAMVVTSLGSL